jgi:hypothetical protein
MIPNAVTLALGVALALLLAFLGHAAWKKSRVSPEERERRRRATLVAYGKLGDATLVEVREGLLSYAYEVRGVEYTAWQDVSKIELQISLDLASVAAVSVKYDPRNPANSIIVAEKWSGLHIGVRPLMRRLK